MRYQGNGPTRCKCCLHTGAEAINAMLMGGHALTDIIEQMKTDYPDEPVLIPANVSRHRKNHVKMPPAIPRPVDPETGLIVKGQLVKGGLVSLETTREVPKWAIPERAVSIPDALKVIINQGVNNILSNPALITGRELMAALDLARKINLFGNDSDEFNDAWAEFGKHRKTKRRTRRRVLEETVEEEGENESITDVTLSILEEGVGNGE